jgi:hypothetical protein
MMDTVINLYNDSPHRAIQGKTPNQMWSNTKEQEKRNIVETMAKDKIFNKLPLGIGYDVRVLENKDKFDKGNAQFSQEIYEIHDRVGYSYKVKDDEGSVKCFLFSILTTSVFIDFIFVLLKVFLFLLSQPYGIVLFPFFSLFL